MLDVYNNVKKETNASKTVIRQFVNAYKLLRILNGTQITTLLDDLTDFEVHRQETYSILKQIPVKVQDPSIAETAINEYMVAHPKSWVQQHIIEDQNFIFMLAEKTESVASGVTDEERRNRLHLELQMKRTVK